MFVDDIDNVRFRLLLLISSFKTFKFFCKNNNSLILLAPKRVLFSVTTFFDDEKSRSLIVLDAGIANICQLMMINLEINVDGFSKIIIHLYHHYCHKCNKFHLVENSNNHQLLEMDLIVHQLL